MTPRLLAHGPFLGEHPHLTPALSSPGGEREKWSVQPAFLLRPWGEEDRGRWGREGEPDVQRPPMKRTRDTKGRAR